MIASMRRRLAWLLLVLAAPMSDASETAPAAAPTTVIHAGSVLAVPGETPLGPHTIVVRDGKIAAIEPGFRAADAFGAEARFVDLSDRFVLPGLIDLHMHLAIIMDAGPETATSESRLALAAAGYAAGLLQAGVTTVRDVGDNTGVTYALRDAFADGILPGPRVFAAGRIVSRTGGHGAKRAGSTDLPYVPSACDGEESCRRAVRENVERGSDWIKLTVSGSGREVSGQADAEPILFDEEVHAVAEAAGQAQRPIAAHAHSTAAINLALVSGARTIEHGTYFDEESIALFKRKQAFLVPTAFVADFVRGKLEMFAGGQDSRQSADLKAWADAAVANPGRAWRAGIRLGLGTDGGPSFGPTATAREIELDVASGVPAAEAIKAATTNGAEILGFDDKLGMIRPGYIADLIAVEGSPLEDASNLHRVVFVMKDGDVHQSCTSFSDPDCAPDAARQRSE